MQCGNIEAVDSTMFLGLKVVLALIYKGFRGPVLSFDAPFWWVPPYFPKSPYLLYYFPGPVIVKSRKFLPVFQFVFVS